LLLEETLVNLDIDLRKRYGNSLTVLSGSRCATVLMNQLLAIKASLCGEQRLALFYNRHYEPWERDSQDEVERQCRLLGIQSQSFSAFLFKEPESCPIFQSLRQGQHIFKAFWEGWHKGGHVREALPYPAKLPPISSEPVLTSARKLDPEWPFGGHVPPDRRLSLVGKKGTLQGGPETEALLAPWRPLTETEAWTRLERFLAEGGLKKYVGSITRDAGPSAKESRLSPFYRLGLLSMVSAYWQLDHSLPQSKKWLRRCAWRDYAYWMLTYWKDLPERPMRPAYDSLEWSDDSTALRAWQCGTTGWPLVDAAMRELRQTGYLQQHLRHIVGQFLVEVIGASWVKGEEWFHVCLADADVAINAMMWQHQGLTGVSQWLTSVECHPVRQAQKADPDGEYVRQYCPELAKLPLQYLHQPWAAPEGVCRNADVRLGVTYPLRIIEDLDRSRAGFMKRLQLCRARRPDCLARGGNDTIKCPQTCPVPGLTSIVALTEHSVKEGSHDQGMNVAKRSGAKGSGKNYSLGKRSKCMDDSGKDRRTVSDHRTTNHRNTNSPWPPGSDADRAWNALRFEDPAPARRWRRTTVRY